MERVIKVQSSARPAAAFSRDKPLMALALAVVIFVAHHFYVIANEEGFFFVLWLMPPLAALGIAGLMHPPIYYSITNKASLVPLRTKLLAGLIALAGFAAGLYIEIAIYDFPNPYMK